MNLPPPSDQSTLQLRFQKQLEQFLLDVNLSLPSRGFIGIFGESGSGKTTLLRILAGLETATQVYLDVQGVIWQDDEKRVFLPVHQRALGYVFQDAYLFTHLTIWQNLQYGARRTPKRRRHLSLEQIVELFDIGHLTRRFPRTLSGGERQRVAMARALAASPRILLMDEPLAALDNRRKAEIMPFLQQLKKTLDIPILYVSHSVDEIAQLTDHLVVIAAGKIIASDRTDRVMTRLDLDIAHGDKAGSIIRATVEAYDAQYHLSRVVFPGGELLLPQKTAEVGQPVRFRIQARDVSLSLTLQQGSSILNTVAATVTAIADDEPGQVMIKLDANGTQLLSRITKKSLAVMQLTTGSAIYAHIKGVAILNGD